MVRRNTTIICKGCDSAGYTKKSFIDHVFSNQYCQQHYHCFFACKTYVGDTKQGLMQHFKSRLSLTVGCETFYNQRCNHDVVNVPEIPIPCTDKLIAMKDDDFQMTISSDNEINQFGTSLYKEYQPLTHVFKQTSNDMQYIQFQSNSLNNIDSMQIGKKRKVSHDIKSASTSASIFNTFNHSFGRYGSIIKTLPGMQNERFILCNTADEENPTCTTSSGTNYNSDSEQEDQVKLTSKSSIQCVDVMKQPNENFQFETTTSNCNNISDVNDCQNANRRPFDYMNFDLRSVQKQFSNKCKGTNFSSEDACLLDLYQILDTSNVPKHMFDKIINWCTKHKEIISHGQLRKRDKIMKHWYDKCSIPGFSFLPSCKSISLSSGRKVNMTTFSLKNIILQMISDKSFFKSENLIIDPAHPTTVPSNKCDYSEPNTGTWYKNAANSLCSTPKHFIMNFACFIDKIKMDKFGTMGVEPVMIV